MLSDCLSYMRRLLLTRFPVVPKVKGVGLPASPSKASWEPVKGQYVTEIFRPPKESFTISCQTSTR